MDSDEKFIKQAVDSSLVGGLWVIGWLFTIGFLDLSFSKGLFAIVLWPYYIGEFVATLVK